MRALRVAIWLCVVSAVSGPGVPSSTLAHGAFAFSDKAGTRLLVPSTLSHPERIETALCGGKVRGPVVFARQQSERQGGPGRKSSENFDDLAGSVFRLTSGKLGDEDTCFLATGPLLSGATIVPVVAQGGTAACAADTEHRLASSRSRPVVHCWVIGRMPKDGQIVLAEFARRGKDALASLVLIEADRSIFADFPAEYDGDHQSVWRVDDEGVLYPDRFEVVFALERGAFRTLAISWGGVEGASLSLFVSDRGNRFVPVIADYWYRAPV
jgi:hypothetical protein